MSREAWSAPCSPCPRSPISPSSSCLSRARWRSRSWHTQLGDRLPSRRRGSSWWRRRRRGSVAGAAGDVSVSTVERVAVVALMSCCSTAGWTPAGGGSGVRPGLCWRSAIAGTFITAALLTVAAYVLLGFDWKLAGIVGQRWRRPTLPSCSRSWAGARSRSRRHHPGGRGRGQRPGLHRADDRGDRARHPCRRGLHGHGRGVRRGDGDRTGLRPGRRARGARAAARPAAQRSPLPGVRGGAGRVLYSVTSLAGGSGFLAVFVAGLFLGDASIPYKTEIERFQSSLAGLAEIVVFIALGLTIDITHLPGQTWLHGAVLTLVLAVLARPLAVALTLTGS